jgi:hypothetical protein
MIWDVEKLIMFYECAKSAVLGERRDGDSGGVRNQRGGHAHQKSTFYL